MYRVSKCAISSAFLGLSLIVTLQSVSGQTNKIACPSYPLGTWGDPNYKSPEGNYAYAVGIRANLTDCAGCTASISGVNFSMPYFGWPDGARIVVEGRLWTNWQYSQPRTRDMFRIDLLAQYTSESGVAPVDFPQIIMEFNPVQSTRTFVVRGQSMPSVWAYEKNYSWPYAPDSVFPTHGFDDLYRLFPGQPSFDSNETVWIQIQRRSNGFEVSTVILPDFNVTGFTYPTFFVEDFVKTSGDTTGMDDVYAIHVLGMNNYNAQMWAIGFEGLPDGVATTTPGPTTTRDGDQTGTGIGGGGGGGGGDAAGAPVFGPVMAAIGGGILAAAGAAMAYYGLSGAETIVEESDLDMEDFPEEIDDTESALESMEPTLDSFNAENYVDVDPDNSFWRATTIDQFA